MTEGIVAAIIAALVSLIVAAISYYSNRRSLESKSKDIEKQIKHQFTDKLYDLRLQHYSNAFELTEKIRHRKQPYYINSQDEIKSILNELREWKKGQASLVMSKDTIECLRDLRSAMAKNPGHGQSYSEEQAEKILKRTSRFRGSMRSDLGILYKEDED